MSYSQHGSADGLTASIFTTLPGKETTDTGPQTAAAYQPVPDLLNAARRIDWRFLLDSPDLGRVLYVGEESSLAAALKLLCPSFEAVDEASLATKVGSAFDTVVARTPANDMLPALAGAVRLGGSLYLEGGAIQARNFASARTALGALLRRSRQCTPDAYRRALHKLGFDQVDTYWMWPDFDHCTRILSIEQGRLAHQLCVQWRGRRLLQSLVGSRAAALLIRTPLFDYFVPAFCIVAAKPSPRAGTGLHQ